MAPPSKQGGYESSRNKNSSVCFTVKINSLWSIWYCTLSVGIQLYIVTVSIKRFSGYIALPWPVQDQPYLELNAYIGFLGASIVLMPFFIATSLLRIGNYPNDGHKIIVKLDDPNLLYENVRRKRHHHWARSIWRHAGPMSSFLHVASAFCLLLPKIFIQAQLVKHGFSRKGEVWSSELDFLMTHRDRIVSFSFLSAINETELLSREMLPGTQADSTVQAHMEEGTISLEFLNYGLALLVYAVRYPSVFWEASKPFGFLFSFQLLLNGLQQLLAFTGFGILYKVQVFGPREILVRYDPFMLNVTTTVTLFLLYNVAISATSCTIYCYGLQKHREWLERKLKRHYVTWGREIWRLWGYIPHVSAFFVFLLLACTATPITYDLILVYCGSLDGAILAVVISTVSHLFLWIVLWLFLTLKQHWRFKGPNKHRAASNVRLSCNGHVMSGMGECRTKQRGSSKGEAPLLVVDNGHTYQIRDQGSKKAILNVAHNLDLGQRNSSSNEDIYWLKPKALSPKDLVESMAKDSWSSTPHKKTFQEISLNSSPTRRKPTGKEQKLKKQYVACEEFSLSGSEDGEYATLTNIPSAKDSDARSGTRWKGLSV